MDDAAIAQQLLDLGLVLPPTPQPLAAYVPVVISGTLAVVSGQVPMQAGVLVNPGTLGDEVGVEEGSAAAAQAALQVLAALRTALGSFDRLVRLVQVTVFVAATPDFIDHPKVANGASELFAKVLGEDGKHARAAVGVSSLPLGASVEVAAIAEVRPA